MGLVLFCTQHPIMYSCVNLKIQLCPQKNVLQTIMHTITLCSYIRMYTKVQNACCVRKSAKQILLWKFIVDILITR